MSNVNLDEIKQRMRDQELAPAPATARPADERSPVRKETLEQVARFEQEFREANAAPSVEKKVDLGPLPEGITGKDELDTVLYRDTIFDNKRVRRTVESRCIDMDFADLVLTGRVSQKVPVISGKLTFEFQSLTGGESYWIESRAQSEATTDWGLRSWVVWAQLTMSLVSVNGSQLPSHQGKDGEVDDKLFAEKRTRVMKLGAKVLDIAVTNMNWFNDRVDRIFQNDFEQLGNG
jgi:hypothetical protein